MRVLLDTCTFLWITQESAEISLEAERAFRDAGNEIFLSVVSAWEIAVKYAAGRLILKRPPSEFIPSARTAYGIQSLPLMEEEALQAGFLPHIHGDPFDRMLVSQAITHNLTILTPDPMITQYPVQTLW